MELSALLGATAEDLSKNGRTLRGYLQRDDVAMDQFQNLVRQVRRMVARISQTLGVWSEGILAILDEGFTVENRLMNPSYKIVRPKIEKEHAELLQFLYTPVSKNVINERNMAAMRKLLAS